MACVVMLAGETGEIFSKRNALALTAAGMAICDPTIVAQAGFLFSFSSVAGMAFLRDPIRRFLRFDAGRGMFGWKEAVVVSVASLVPIVPLVSAMFGSFSLTAIFANVLVAGMIPLGMTAGSFAVSIFGSRAFWSVLWPACTLHLCLWQNTKTNGVERYCSWSFLRALRLMSLRGGKFLSGVRSPGREPIFWTSVKATANLWSFRTA
jgi:predicted membrane metal-binding protein